MILVAVLLPLGAFAGGSIEGTVRLDEMKPHPVSPGYKIQTAKPVGKAPPAVAVVFLEGTGTASLPQRQPPAVIRQRDYQFDPAILVVQKGTAVEFPNEDDEFHNVFSYSKTKRFDLGRYRKDEKAAAVVFDKAGLAKIYCEIHQHMRCLILVVDTPVFTTTDTSGRFKLSGIPAGDYTLKVMLPSEKIVEQKVTVSEGRTAAVNAGE